jgi:prolyl-tRNA synthetase
MRYRDLNIETYRHAPARARTEAEALLIRAGYVKHEGGLTPLGQQAAARIEQLAKARPMAEVFGLLELPVRPTAAEEYYFPAEQGRVELAVCSSCGYAMPRPLAEFRKPEPPAEEPLALEKVLTPDCHTIEALALYLGIPKERSAKALMYTRPSDGKFIFAAVRGDMQLSEPKLQKLVGEVRLATNEEITATGAAPGYASPIGLKDALVVVDDLVARSPNLVAGANEPGYHLKNTNYGRDYTAEIVRDVALAEPGAPCPNCGAALTIRNAERLADAQGICEENVLEALAQAHHDEKGLVLPSAAAPFTVYLMQLPGKELDTLAQAEQLYESWEAAGIPVLLDDRSERAGVKFTDADLIGCPVRATVGERGMKDGMVELKSRSGTEIKPVPFAEALGLIQSWTKPIP